MGVLVILQNCRDLVKVVPGSYSEIYVMSQDVKVEELSDIQEEEDPLLLPVPIIKAEHEVSFLCHC
jgi:hypothetical protein